MSDTSEAAQEAAAGCIEQQGATSAATEMAVLVRGPEMAYYEHCGTGWTAWRNPETKVVEWEAFHR